MPCCGGKRAEAAAPEVYPSGTYPDQRPQTGPIRRPMVRPDATVTFEYTGETAMAVIGGVTRLRYTFITPGAREEADARDRESLAAVPQLTKMS